MGRRSVARTSRYIWDQEPSRAEIDAMLDRFSRRFDATINRAERLDQAGAIDLDAERNNRRRPHAGK